MTDTQDLTALLGEPSLAITSTWDIVVTPWLSLNLSRAHEETNKDDPDQLVQVVITGNHVAYAIGGLAALKANLDNHHERFVRCAAFPAPSVYDGPEWLERALEGQTRYRSELDPFIWDYFNTFTGLDWEVAERTNEPLRMIKQVRKVKCALAKRGLEVPTTWREAIVSAARNVPEVFDRGLAANFEHLS